MNEVGSLSSDCMSGPLIGPLVRCQFTEGGDAWIGMRFHSANYILV